LDSTIYGFDNIIFKGYIMNKIWILLSIMGFAMLGCTEATQDKTKNVNEVLDIKKEVMETNETRAF